MPGEPSRYSYNQSKCGDGEKAAFFLIIEETSRFHHQLSGPQGIVFHTCREPVLPQLAHGQDARLLPPLFYCLGACPVLLGNGFVAKPGCSFCG